MLPKQAPSSTQARNIHENTRILELQRIHPDFDTTETFLLKSAGFDYDGVLWQDAERSLL